MLPFRKILFPVDYSAPCQAVVPYVQDMARRFSAEICLVHAYTPLTAITQNELFINDPGLQEKARALEEDRLRQYACQAFPSLRPETMVELGEPGGVVDRVAHQQRADLVMLATRGQGPVRRFLMGSTTAKVLHDVSAAVWTGVGAALADHPARVPYRSILCALDDSTEVESILRAAHLIASAYEAQLSIVHVVSTPPPYPDVDLVDHLQMLTDAAQCRIRELKAKLSLDAPHSVVHAVLADGICQEIVRRNADLLVTGRGHTIGTFSRLWSHLYSIIRDAPCPVLSV